jgi:hypothetical protein
MHLPSAAKLWHSPAATVLPMPCPSFFREEPLELHDTSYFAASPSIFSLSIIDICGAILISILPLLRAVFLFPHIPGSSPVLLELAERTFFSVPILT